MLNLDETWIHHLPVSLWLSWGLVEAFNAIQSLSHTHSSSPHSLVTWVQSQSVTRIITQVLLRVVQSDIHSMSKVPQATPVPN